MNHGIHKLQAIDSRLTPAPGKGLQFNKAVCLSDFSHPELLPVLRAVCSYKIQHLGPHYPRGSEHRKDWEVAMAVRTLRHFGATKPDSVVLGVAAGTEDTAFYLTRYVRQVFAIDLYADPDKPFATAPLVMLVDPASVARFDFDANRLVVQHMDARNLRYPDETFDGIFSSGSIEHFGSLDDVSTAAREMARVLKPGGVMTISTELRLSGPSGGGGLPGTLLFSADELSRYIVEASGLTPVDQLSTDVSDETRAMPRDLVETIVHRANNRNEDPTLPEELLDELPHIVVTHEGYEFTSVHLAMTKPQAPGSP